MKPPTPLRRTEENEKALPPHKRGMYPPRALPININKKIIFLFIEISIAFPTNNFIFYCIFSNN